MCGGIRVFSFTLPYISETDVLPLGTYPGVLQFSLYNDIVSPNTSIEPSIDMVIFSAAAPDFQLFYPCATPVAFVYDYPAVTSMKTRRNARRRQQADDKPQRQCDIDSAFKETFPPFVAGCTYYTDQKYVNSESTVLVLDVLKRYQSAVTGANINANSISLNGFYNPQSGTLGLRFLAMFAYCRGGVNYKICLPDCAPVLARLLDGTSNTPLVSNGSATTFNSLPGQALDFACPWVDYLPFRYTSDLSGYPTKFAVDMNATFENGFYFVRVRDDYQVGFLIAPPEDG